MSAIFISYRREDSEDSARAIFESLRPVFGKERLFMDVEAIALGSDFRDAVEVSLTSCGVFLAIIGPNWLNVRASHDPNASRRLDNPNDYVRQEIASALKKGRSLPVIPVLVRGATIPTPEQLPDDLKDLTYRNALTLNNLDWDASVFKLTKTIRAHISDSAAADLEASRGALTQPAAVRASTVPAPTTTTLAGGTRKALLIGIPVVLALAAVGAYFVFRSKPVASPVPASQQRAQSEPRQPPPPVAASIPPVISPSTSSTSPVPASPIAIKDSKQPTTSSNSKPTKKLLPSTHAAISPGSPPRDTSGSQPKRMTVEDTVRRGDTLRLSGNYAEAAQAYRDAGDRGNAYAQNELGFLYEYGQGVPKDYQQAAQWFRKSADQGYALAQFNLGALYLTGSGVSKDYGQTAQWYRKAADQGLPKAQFNLGVMYQNGWGVARDASLAQYWFLKAKAGGYQAH